MLKIEERTVYFIPVHGSLFRRICTTTPFNLCTFVWLSIWGYSNFPMHVVLLRSAVDVLFQSRNLSRLASSPPRTGLSPLLGKVHGSCGPNMRLYSLRDPLSNQRRFLQSLYFGIMWCRVDDRRRSRSLKRSVTGPTERGRVNLTITGIGRINQMLRLTHAHVLRTNAYMDY